MGRRASNLISSNVLDSLFIAHLYDFLWCSKSTSVRGFRNRASHQLVPPPSTKGGWSATGAIKQVFFRGPRDSGYKTRPVLIGTEGNQVSSEALRTFHAMAKKRRHKSCASRYSVPEFPLSHSRFVLVDFACPSSQATAMLPDGHCSVMEFNSEAKPSRRSICRRTFLGNLPRGLA